MKKKKSPAQRAALYGVLVALAMILSYIEVLIPLPIGIPGVKPGLANLVVFFCTVFYECRGSIPDLHGENCSGQYHIWKWIRFSVQYGRRNFKLSGHVDLPEKGFSDADRGQYSRWDCT